MWSLYDKRKQVTCSLLPSHYGISSPSSSFLFPSIFLSLYTVIFCLRAVHLRDRDPSLSSQPTVLSPGQRSKQSSVLVKNKDTPESKLQGPAPSVGLKWATGREYSSALASWEPNGNLGTRVMPLTGWVGVPRLVFPASFSQASTLQLERMSNHNSLAWGFFSKPYWNWEKKSSKHFRSEILLSLFSGKTSLLR